MPVPLPLAVAAVVLTTVAGGLLGAATRWWLAWLRRGADVPVVWCVAGVGALWAGVASAWVCRPVPGAAVPLLLGLAWLAVAGSAVDLAVRRLPDALTWPAVPVVLALLVPLGGAAVLRGIAGAVLLWSVHGIVRRCAPSAMGGGDVRLAASVGAALGGVSWVAIAVGTVLAAVFSAVSGPALRVATGSASAAERAGSASVGRTAGSIAVPLGSESAAAGSAPVPLGSESAAAGWAAVPMGTAAAGSASAPAESGSESAAAGWAAVPMGAASAAAGSAAVPLGSESAAAGWAAVPMGAAAAGSASAPAGSGSASVEGSSRSTEVPPASASAAAGSASAAVPIEAEPAEPAGRGYTVPHGPSMLLACLVTVAAAAAWPGAGGAG